VPARYPGIPHEGVGGAGVPAEAYGYSLPAKARVMEDAGRSVWVSSCKGAGRVGGRRGIRVSAGEGTRRGGEDVWGLGSVRDRGGGTSSPSPSAPPPMAISPRSSTWGDPGEEPGTVAHRLHPGYGCSPDIASTAPAHGRGRGRSAGGAGGVGAAGRECMGIPTEARAGWGLPAENVWVSLRRRGRGGGCRQKSMGIPLRRPGRCRGCRQKRMGIPQQGEGRRGLWILLRRKEVGRIPYPGPDKV